MLRACVFLMPLVAALNPILPVVGPVSALPALSALLFVMSVFSADVRRSSGTFRTLAIIFSASLLSIAALTLLTRFGAVWAHNEAVAVVSGSLLVLSMCMLRASIDLVRLICTGWLLTFGVTGMLAVVELATGTRIGANYLDVNPLASDIGIVSVFFNPNNYAAFLSFSLPLLVVGGALARASALRVLYRVALVSAFPLMLATGSRFGIASLIMFVAVWLILRWRKPLTQALVALFTLIAMTIVITVANTTMIGYWGNVEYSIPLFGIDVPVDASLFARWNLAQNGWELLSANPVFGAGPGGFEIWAQANTPSRLTFGIINPHNGFVELASQYGIVLLVLGTLVAVSMLAVGRRVHRDGNTSPVDRTLAFSIIAATAMLPLVLLMNSSYLEILHTWAAFAAFTVITRYLNRVEDPVSSDPATASESMPDAAGR